MFRLGKVKSAAEGFLNQYKTENPASYAAALQVVGGLLILDGFIGIDNPLGGKKRSGIFGSLIGVVVGLVFVFGSTFFGKAFGINTMTATTTAEVVSVSQPTQISGNDSGSSCTVTAKYTVDGKGYSQTASSSSSSACSLTSGETININYDPNKPGAWAYDLATVKMILAIFPIVGIIVSIVSLFTFVIRLLSIIFGWKLLKNGRAMAKALPAGTDLSTIKNEIRQNFARHLFSFGSDNMNKNQNGFGIVLVLVALVVLVGIGFAGVKVLSKQSSSKPHAAQPSVSTGQSQTEKGDEEAPPVLAKNIGFNFDFYDPATKRAGDFVFANIPALSDPISGNSMWHDFGALDNKPGSGQRNPQTVFFLPGGTKITAMIDGEVVGMTELYSKDYGIMIAKDKQSKWRYEHEHVVKPTVKIGDKVKAGDVIAEVGAHTNYQYAGYGFFEIGLYRPHPNGVGGHEDCVFKFLDPSVKKDIEAKVTAFYKGWEEYRGDSTIYDEANNYSPGCVTGDTISWEKVQKG